jgi:hypothetical protein
MIYVIYVLAAIGAYRVWQWGRELWRTRKDRGYNAHKWGAF